MRLKIFSNRSKTLGTIKSLIANSSRVGWSYYKRTLQANFMLTTISSSSLSLLSLLFFPLWTELELVFFISDLMLLNWSLIIWFKLYSVWIAHPLLITNCCCSYCLKVMKRRSQIKFIILFSENLNYLNWYFLLYFSFFLINYLLNKFILFYFV